MAKITLTIEADSSEDLQATLTKLQSVNVETKVIEIPEEKTQGIKKTPEKAEPEKKASTKKKPAAKKEASSSDSTSDTEPSKVGKAQEPTKDDEPATSTTPNRYPDADMADVRAAVKKALEKNKRNEVRTALERQNVSKVPELDPSNFGVFMTDLEALVGE